METPRKLLIFFQGLLRSKRRLFSGIILFLLIVFLGSKIFGKKEQSIEYQTATVERGTIVSSVSASGQILTANIINITSNASGLVKKVYVKDGDKIAAGQKIIELDLDTDSKQRSASAYSSYLSAKNSLESAVINLWTLDSAMWAANRTFINDAVARGLPTWDPTYIQENDNWLAAEAKYKSQKAVIEQAQRAVSNTWLSYQQVSPVVTAPTLGVITNITYTEGMTLGGTTDSSQRIAVIRLEGNPIATFNVSEIDVSKIKPGQKATTKLDSFTDKTYTGKVVTVDRIGLVTSGVINYPVVIKFDTGSFEILPNMSATATIILESKDNVLLVPSTAISDQQGQSVVQVLKGKQQQTVVVETGLSSDNQTEIVLGLKEGDIVISGTVSSITARQEGASPFGGGVGGMFRMAR